MWFAMILQALPIPYSLMTVLDSVISIANISAVAGNSVVVAVLATVTMLLAGTYTVTYVYSARKTFSEKRISPISFLPLAHIVLAFVFLTLWIIAEEKFL